MARRCLSLPGTPDLWIRLGWLQSSTRNGMKWGALTLLEISHSRGCYLKFAVLLVQRVCSPRRPKTKDPGLCALEAYIAGDTLRHQPMGAGHVTVLQLCGPMGLRVLQWCHPMLACAKRTSYCTRIITLYGARKVDSGPHTIAYFSAYKFPRMDEATIQKQLSRPTKLKASVQRKGTGKKSKLRLSEQFVQVCLSF